MLSFLLFKLSHDDDERLAQHAMVTYVHMYNKPPDLEDELLDPAPMR
jgi:hypothetical protein